jgi:hypothetical protein
MGALTAGRAALLCAALGFLLLPWHGLERGLAELAAWPGGTAAPLALLLLDGSRWWLWPVALLLGLAALPLLRGKAPGTVLTLAGAGILVWVALMGQAIGLRGLDWDWLAPLLGAPPPQPSLGWGALLVLVGAVGLLSAGLAARGAFGADAFIAFLVTGSALLLALFVFAPLATILTAAIYDGDRFAPDALAARLTAPEAWSLACLASGLRRGVEHAAAGQPDRVDFHRHRPVLRAACGARRHAAQRVGLPRHVHPAADHAALRRGDGADRAVWPHRHRHHRDVGLVRHSPQPLDLWPAGRAAGAGAGPGAHRLPAAGRRAARHFAEP